MARELISKKTRIEFREFLVGWTLRTISDEFEAEGIECRIDYVPPVGGERRSLVEQYYKSLDFKRWGDIQKLLRVYENILNTTVERDPDAVTKLSRFLARDGYTYQDGKIASAMHDMRILQEAKNISFEFNVDYMTQQIARIEMAINQDPVLAIGSAKELVETCCRTILSDRGNDIPRNVDAPKLIKLTMSELKLLPEDIPESAKGSESIRRLLSNLATVVQGLAEIRNLYGSGHGQEGRTKTLGSRHAKLAVGAATTLVVFLFETHIETFNKQG